MRCSASVSFLPFRMRSPCSTTVLINSRVFLTASLSEQLQVLAVSSPFAVWNTAQMVTHMLLKVSALGNHPWPPDQVLQRGCSSQFEAGPSTVNFPYLHSIILETNLEIIMVIRYDFHLLLIFSFQTIKNNTGFVLYPVRMVCL